MLIAALAGLAALHGGAAPDRLSTPGATAAAFYRIYLQVHPSGAGDRTTRERFAPVLTSRLMGRLAQAQAAEADYAKKTKGEVPPLMEGDAFTSLFEGAGRFHIAGCQTARTRSRCRTDLVNASPGQKPTRWHDTLVLQLTSTGWKVDDVIYGGTWAFGPKGSLSHTLTAAVADAAKP